MTSGREWIEYLGLVPHPEGGFYREVYRSSVLVPPSSLPGGFSSDRSLSSLIYFLLLGDDFSAFHRLKQDEIWHFYAGDPLTLHVIEPSGSYRADKLGLDIAAHREPQAVIKAGCWFAAGLDENLSYSLVGCTTSPGFDFADFDMPSPGELIGRFPRHRELIERFTRASGPGG